MKILIVGGGTGGVILANLLAKRLPSSVELLLIEKEEKHYYQPGFTLFCFGLIKEAYLSKPVMHLLSKRVKVIRGEVLKLDPLKKEVHLSSDKSLSYDILILATGAELFWDKIPGVREGLKRGVISEFYTFLGAQKLKGLIPLLEGGRIISAIGGIPIKCPAAPIKFLLLLEDYTRKKGLRKKFHFIFLTPAGQVLGRNPYAEVLEKICQEREIEVIKNFQITKIDPEKRKVLSEAGELSFDFLIFTPPHRVFTAFSEIEDFLDEAGFIKVNPHTFEHQVYEGIYALGDAAGLPTAKTASGVRLQAKVLAQRLSSFLKEGKPSPLTYNGEILCPVMTRFGKIMFSRYDYEKSLSPPSESLLNWILHVHLGKYLYWQIFLRGF